MPASRRNHASLVVLALASFACSRDPIDEPCPDLDEGDLVVTEVRGPQDQDTETSVDEWIELYAVRAADLAGLRVSLTKIDGSETATFFVRDALDVAAGDYVVLGRHPAEALPGHVDYGFGDDLTTPLYPSAGVDVSSCGTRLDRMIYRGLTDFGTLSLDGAIAPPSAADNDDEAAFCVDDHLEDADPSAARGSPGAPNLVCP